MPNYSALEILSILKNSLKITKEGENYEINLDFHMKKKPEIQLNLTQTDAFPEKSHTHVKVNENMELQIEIT